MGGETVKVVSGVREVSGAVSIRTQVIEIFIEPNAVRGMMSYSINVYQIILWLSLSYDRNGYYYGYMIEMVIKSS